METGSSGHLGLKLGQGCQLVVILKEYASNAGDSDTEDKITLILRAEPG